MVRCTEQHIDTVHVLLVNVGLAPISSSQTYLPTPNKA